MFKANSCTYISAASMGTPSFKDILRNSEGALPGGWLWHDSLLTDTESHLLRKHGSTSHFALYYQRTSEDTASTSCHDSRLHHSLGTTASCQNPGGSPCKASLWPPAPRRAGPPWDITARCWHTAGAASVVRKG